MHWYNILISSIVSSSLYHVVIWFKVNEHFIIISPEIVLSSAKLVNHRPP